MAHLKAEDLTRLEAGVLFQVCEAIRTRRPMPVNSRIARRVGASPPAIANALDRVLRKGRIVVISRGPRRVMEVPGLGRTAEHPTRTNRGPPSAATRRIWLAAATGHRPQDIVLGEHRTLKEGTE